MPSGTDKVRRSSEEITIEVRISSEMNVVRTRCSAVECGLRRQASRERRLTTVQPSHQRKDRRCHSVMQSGGKRPA